ncbi:MAG: TldD/PmbA family protein, partial [Acidimicrobiales bacterium]
ADLHDRAARIAAAARAAENVEVVVARSVDTEVRAHGGDVESLTVAESVGVGVRITLSGREGFAHAGTFDTDVVEGLLPEARDNAGFSVPDEHVGPAEPDGATHPDIDPWHEGVITTPIEHKIGIALATEAAATAADPRVRGVRTAVYRDSRTERAIVATTGITAEVRSTGASVSATALLDDTDGRTRTGSAVRAARSPGELDPALVGSLAVERAVVLLGARPPRTGRVTVVLEPRFAATLLGIVAGMLSAERVLKGRTPFADRMGDRIGSPALGLVDDPTDPDSLGATAADGEGLATRSVPLIVGGVLRGFLHDTHTARALATTSTGSARRGARSRPSPGHRAIHVSPGRGDLASLISGVDDGLLVQSLQGVHSGVNAVSGDLSIGVEGLRIRDGEPAEPVREATLAGAIPRLMLDMAAVGADLERQPGGARVPSLVVEGLVLGGAPAARPQLGPIGADRSR